MKIFKTSSIYFMFLLVFSISCSSSSLSIDVDNRTGEPIYEMKIILVTNVGEVTKIIPQITNPRGMVEGVASIDTTKVGLLSIKSASIVLNCNSADQKMWGMILKDFLKQAQISNVRMHNDAVFEMRRFSVYPKKITNIPIADQGGYPFGHVMAQTDLFYKIVIILSKSDTTNEYAADIKLVRNIDMSLAISDDER